MPHDLIDAAKVRKEMQGMIKMITHPAFVDAMRQMKATPVSGRRELGKKLLTVAALRKEGAPIPSGMRLTTRYFEPGKTEVLEVSPEGKIRVSKVPRGISGKFGGGPVSWGGCACGGGLSFCGGAGGST